MKFTSLAIGLTAIAAVLGPAAGVPAPKPKSTNPGRGSSSCASGITYQLIGYLNTKDIDNVGSYCKPWAAVGYVAGIGLFNTNAGSILAVVDKFMASSDYKDEFKGVYDALKKAAETKATSTAGLEALCPAWVKASATGDAFYNAQVSVFRELKEAPLKSSLKKYKLPITKAVILQYSVTNGVADTGFGVGAVIKDTDAAFTDNFEGTSGSTLTIGDYKVDEIEWLYQFMEVADGKAKGLTAGFSKILSSLVRKTDYKLSSAITFTGFSKKKVTIDCKPSFKSAPE
ncbi:hypothetical protein H4R19_001105 [Coemansia spiralis]|nr:hypothetical protein H4R19_001105 [Coemansia spiralis]